MTKAQLINEICKLMGKQANRQYLNSRSVAQLQETYQRWQAIAKVTRKEIIQNCNTNF